jgi:cyclic dehypoxanthinyl futalosine synthase
MGISREQALDCFHSDDLLGIGMEADAVRRRLHPEGTVGYAIEARIDCAKLADETASAGRDGLYAAITEAAENDCHCIRLLGCTRHMDASQTAILLQEIRRRVPSTWIEALSTAEIQSLAAARGLSLRETLARLIDAGLNAIADEGIPLADETPHSVQSSVADWLDVHRTAHALGMHTIAGMIFGAGETPQQRVDFLQSIRQLQQETGGFAAFAPLTAEAPGGRELDAATAVERLRTLAIARMFLDTIDTVHASSTPQGLKVLQTSLRFGANDVGAISFESGSEEDIRRIIRDAGLRPAKRELGYRAMLLA